METYYAVVCEDHERSLQFISHELRHAFEEQKIPMHIEQYSSPQKLYQKSAEGQRGKYDVLFLDIDMPGISGIELCKKMQELGNDSLVIFISNKDELVFQTFTVKPFRFVRKSHFKAELPILIEDIKRELINKSEDSIIIQEKHSERIYRFRLQDVVYIEALSKDCCVVTKHHKTMITARISDLEKQLNPHGFVRCHRSYLVNCRNIFSICKNEVHLENGQCIPVSRSKAECVRQKFFSYINGGAQ